MGRSESLTGTNRVYSWPSQYMKTELAHEYRVLRGTFSDSSEINLAWRY